MVCNHDQSFREVAFQPSVVCLPELFCLKELRDTVEWVYDCTVAYEGVP